MTATLIKSVHLDGKTADVLIRDNKFSQISAAAGADIKADTVVDGRGKAILPAFYNTHTHSVMGFLRGVGEDTPLQEWLEKHIWPREAKLTADMLFPLARFGVLEMIKTGTVFFNDMFSGLETIAAVHDMGVRAAISQVVALDTFNPRITEQQIQDIKQAMETPSPTPRIMKSLSAHAVYTVSERLFRYNIDIAKEHGAFLHTHASETAKEVDDCIEKYGIRPVQLLEKWGALGEKTVLAHCLHLADDEIQAIAATGTIVSHCPSSSLKLNSGQMDLQRMFDSGTRMTLGTDSVASNNSLSMIAEMKIAALSAKNRAGSCVAGKVDDVYNMATRGGAQAFGLDAGVIREGALADFILVDLNHHSLMPNINLRSNMIYSADSSCITDVFCDGRPLMRDGVVPDEQEIKDEFAKVCSKLQAL